MDNYLTLLYFMKFEINKREANLMNFQADEDNEKGKTATIRNDQSISEVRTQHDMINRLISAYLKKIKNEE